MVLAQAFATLTTANRLRQKLGSISAWRHSKPKVSRVSRVAPKQQWPSPQ